MSLSPPKIGVSQPVEPLSFQRQRSSQWNSRHVPETPRRPRFGVISDFEKQKKTTASETRDLPSGFQTGPPRSQFAVGRKGKESATLPVSPLDYCDVQLISAFFRVYPP